jgi:hypothetical protein
LHNRIIPTFETNDQAMDQQDIGYNVDIDDYEGFDDYNVEDDRVDMDMEYTNTTGKLYKQKL